MSYTGNKIFHSQMKNAPQLTGVSGSLLEILDFALVNGSGVIPIVSLISNNNILTIETPIEHHATEQQIIKVSGASIPTLNKEFVVKEILSPTTFTVISENVPNNTYTNLNFTFPPAGWINKGNGLKKAYQSKSQSSTGCWAEIDDSEKSFALLTGYEDYMDGVGGFKAFSCLNPYLFKRANAALKSKWVIIADDRTCYIGIDVLPTTVTGRSGSPGYCFGGFGDIASFKENDKYSFFVRGTLGTPSNSFPDYEGSFAATIGSSQFTENDSNIPIRVARSYNEITNNLNCNIYAMQYLTGQKNAFVSGSADSPIPFPDYLGNVIFSDFYVYEPLTKKPRGKMPGLKFCLNAVGDQLHSSGTNLAFVNNIDADANVSYLGLKWYGGVQFFDVSRQWQ